MSDSSPPQTSNENHDVEHDEHHTPGTVALTFFFLACFAVYYFANWKALADVWHVR